MAEFVVLLFSCVFLIFLLYSPLNIEVQQLSMHCTFYYTIDKHNTQKYNTLLLRTYSHMCQHPSRSISLPFSLFLSLILSLVSIRNHSIVAGAYEFYLTATHPPFFILFHLSRSLPLPLSFQYTQHITYNTSNELLWLYYLHHLLKTDKIIKKKK